MRRLNLLPRDRRLTLRHEMTLAAAASLAATILAALLVLTGAGLLAAGGLTLYSRLDGQSAEAELAKYMAAYTHMREAVAERNRLISEIERVGRERVVWSLALTQLWPAVPPGATVGELAIDLDRQTITLAGTAAQRTTLVIFEERLRQLLWVLLLDAPRENLLQPEQADYTFTLHVNPAQLVANPPHGPAQP